MQAKKKISMYNKGGFNPLPDTSYQSPASKSARAKSKNKRKQIVGRTEDYLKANSRSNQAKKQAILAYRLGDNKTLNEKFDETLKQGEIADKAKERLGKLREKPLSEFKEYKGGGKMYGKKGMKVKKYQEGGMNATGETGRRRSSLSSADRSGKTAYQQRQETKKRQMDLFEKELSEKGVYLPKQGQLVKELNVDYPIIPSKDESGRTVPFKEGYIRRGYSGADTRMNQKLGVKPIGQNLSK